MNFLS